MVKIILLYLTLVSCSYIIKVLPQPEPKPEVQQAPPSPAKSSVKTSNTPAVIDRHEPVPVEKEEVKKEREKPLVPLPPKG